jgi:hypothetical protein
MDLYVVIKVLEESTIFREEEICSSETLAITYRFITEKKKSKFSPP